SSFRSATAWRSRPLSTASSAGSTSVCMQIPMPTQTCRALHGWQRCGKRSPARRATPQTTISSENPSFSRCFRSSRKRHASSADRSQGTPVSGDKGIRSGQEDKIFEEEKDEEGGGRCNEEARQEGGREEEEGGEKSGQEGDQESREVCQEA